MKITKIRVKGLQQFKDLEVDLTYPKGHKHAGEPLNKICIIGQSGTGKTSLLSIIKKACLIVPLNSNQNYLPFEFDDHNGFVLVEFVLPNHQKGVIKIDSFRYSITTKGTKDELASVVEEMSFNHKPHIYYFPTSAHSFKTHGINRNSRSYDLNKFGYRENEKDEKLINECKRYQYYIFDSSFADNLWENIIEKTTDYRQKEANFRISLTYHAEQNEGIDIKHEIHDWKNKNLSPLDDIAERCLDNILKSFYLKTKRKVDKVNEINSIQIETLEGNKLINFENLSSGTKQIILTGLPLFLAQPSKSIVLMDEPENSLYPDIQNKLVDYYSSFGEDNQYFYATHSPIVASSFEPWEVLELIFDSSGTVKQEKYYDEDKGRHINNYFIDPRYLTWNSILRKVFDLNEEGNSEFRTPKLMELSEIELKIRSLLNDKEKNSDQIKKLYSTYTDLANLLDWKIA